MSHKEHVNKKMKPVVMGLAVLLVGSGVYWGLNSMQGDIHKRESNYDAQQRLGPPKSLNNAEALFAKTRKGAVENLKGDLLVCSVTADVAKDTAFSIRIKAGGARHTVVPKDADPKAFGISIPDFVSAKGDPIEMRLSTPGHAKDAEVTFSGTLPIKFQSGTFQAECSVMERAWVDESLVSAIDVIDARLAKADKAVLNPKMASNVMLDLEASLKDAVALVGYKNETLSKRLVAAEELRVKWVTRVGDHVTP